MSERDRDDINRPVETLRDGALKVSIFRNRGENGVRYVLDPRRIFTDKESGKIREASSLSGSEPLRMAHLLTKGHERIAEYRAQDKEQARERKEERSSRRSRSRDDERER